MVSIDFDVINEAFWRLGVFPLILLMLLRFLPASVQAAAYPSIASNDDKS
jgi:hypothetical protein